MSNEFLGDRRRALEDSFFSKRDQDLLAELKQQLAGENRKQILAEVSGITDSEILDGLLAANISGESIAALALVPLVVVAWSDGSLDAAERKAILQASGEEGIASNSVGHKLLNSWLEQQPGSDLFAAWKAFVAEAQKQLSNEALVAFREDVIERATNVARISGGILGIGSISSSERSVLDELENAFLA